MNLLSEIGQVQRRLSYFGFDFDACNIRVNIETTTEHQKKRLSPIQSIDIFRCDFDSSACSIDSLSESDCDEHPMVSTCFLGMCELRFGHQNSSVCVSVSCFFCPCHFSFVCLLHFIHFLSESLQAFVYKALVVGNLPKKGISRSPNISAKELPPPNYLVKYKAG